MTQPMMYKLIDNKRSVRKLYTENLIGRNDITPEEADEALRDYQAQLERVFTETKEARKNGHSPMDATSDSGDTGSDAPDNAGLERVFTETKEARKNGHSPMDATSDSGDTGSDAPDNAGLERPAAQTSDATNRSATETGISRTDLKHIGDIFTSPPHGFTVHSKL